MPFGSEGVEDGVGLALSGSGFRASLFHVGVVWRLNELGWLPWIDRISSVSGGSITAAVLGRGWNRLEFEGSVARNLREILTEPLLEFTQRNIDTRAVITGSLLPGTSSASAVEKQYARHLLGDADLGSLPDRPRFVFNATNMTTGSNWRFQKPYAGDCRLGLIRNPRFALSTVVAASAAFPPVLSPMVLDLDPASLEPTDGLDLHDEKPMRRTVVLADGGIYDNLALESIWKRYRTLLVSDAGGSPSIEFGPKRLWHNQVHRAYSLTTEQDRDLRRRILYEGFRSGERGGAYWLIRWPVEKFRATGVLPVAPRWPRELSELRTRLNRFSAAEQRHLINWGYALADAAVRRRVQDLTVPAVWPFQDYALAS